MSQISTAKEESQQQHEEPLASNTSMLSSMMEMFAIESEDQEEGEMKFWKDLNAQKKQNTLMSSALSNHTEHIALPPVRVS